METCLSLYRAVSENRNDIHVIRDKQLHIIKLTKSLVLIWEKTAVNTKNDCVFSN
jgi:hypothetical protein